MVIIDRRQPMHRLTALTTPRDQSHAHGPAKKIALRKAIAMRKISFGASSANAARYAASIGLVTGSEIRLVYILQTPSAFSHHPISNTTLPTCSWSFQNNILRSNSIKAGRKISSSTVPCLYYRSTNDRTTRQPAFPEQFLSRPLLTLNQII